jgi:predicted MFS family arabinose efflux permease
MSGQAPATTTSETAADASHAIGLRRYIVLVAVGAFATTFAQSRVLANLPTTFLLKNQFHLPQQDVAFFFFWVTLPWQVKPLVGVLVDAFPFFGTRRRHYMMLGAAAAGISWAALGPASVSYMPLLLTMLAMNVATIVPSTVMGGLMVEAGQAFGASGTVSSVRQAVQSVAGSLAPAVGGYLAARAYGLTATIGAVTAFSLAVCVFFLLKEPRAVTPAAAGPAVRANRPSLFGPTAAMVLMTVVTIGLYAGTALTQVAIVLFSLVLVLGAIVGLSVIRTTNPVIVRAQDQLGQIFESRTLWMSVVMILLVYTVPGLNTALVYRQTDVLKFSPTFIGVLDTIGNILGLGGAAFYAAFCRRLSLRTMLLVGIGLNGALTLLFLVYTAGTAPYVHGLVGFMSIVTEVAIMDLCIRSTPKGCEALGFALLISVRNFGISMSDVIGTQMLDAYHVSFESLVVVNAATTILVLAFVPFLPKAMLSRREGDA